MKKNQSNKIIYRNISIEDTIWLNINHTIINIEVFDRFGTLNKRCSLLLNQGIKVSPEGFIRAT